MENLLNFQITEMDLEWMEQQFGRKTVNQIRREVGLPEFDQGEIAYVDWLRKQSGLGPKLKLVTKND